MSKNIGVPASRFQIRSEIVSASFGSNCSYIGDYAFNSCTSMKQINEDNAIKSIGSYAFYNTKISSAIFSNLSKLGESAFENCTSLENISIGSCTNIPDNAFKSCTSLTTISVPDDVRIGSSAFMNCGKLQNIKFDNCYTIKDFAFYNCVILGDINFYKCRSIGSYAFYNCSSIQNLSFSYYTNIQSGAFFSCQKLSDVYIYNTSKICKLYDKYTFCKNIDEIKIVSDKYEYSGSVIFYIENSIFNKYKIDSIWSVYMKNMDILNNDGKMILYKSIYNNEETIDTILDDHIDNHVYTFIPIRKIDRGKIIFKENFDINEKDFGTGSIFSDDSKINITELTISSDWTNLQNKVFEGYKSLITINLQPLYPTDTLQSIGKYTFKDCNTLKTLKFPTSITSVGEGAFAGCKIIKFEGNENFVKCDGRAVVYNNTLICVSPNVDTLVEGMFCDISKIDSDITITRLGESCFYGCENLMRVDIPDSVTSIGQNAFYECKNLTEIHMYSNTPPEISYLFNTNNEIIPTDFKIFVPYDSIKIIETNIGDSAYIRGDWVKYTNYIYFKPNKYNITYYGKNQLSSTNTITSFIDITNIYNNIYIDDKNCHLYNIKLKEDKIEDGKINIDYLFTASNDFFDNKKYAKKVLLGEGITLSEGSFSYCELDYIYLNDDLEKIPNECFDKCEYLSNIHIPNSVTTIGWAAFADCSGLTSITIPNSVTKIGKEAFYGCSGLTSVTIGNSVTQIGPWAFYNCDELTEVNYNAKNCTSMGSSDYPVFYNCTNLKTLNIGNEVKNIPAYAFYWCDGLSKVIIPNSVTSIGNYAFYGCLNLKLVINLSNLTFSKGYPNYGYVTYYANKVINAPNNSIVGDFAFYKTDNINTLVAYIGNATKPILPTDFNEGNYVIGEYAFYGCDGLTSVTIPNSVTEIGEEAFYNCYNLTKITLYGKNLILGKFCFARDNNTAFPNYDVYIKTSETPTVGVNAYPFGKPGSNKLPTCIYVPDDKYDDYISDSNWSIYTHIIKPGGYYINKPNT